MKNQKLLLLLFLCLGLNSGLWAQDEIIEEKTLYHVLQFKWIDEPHIEAKEEILNLFRALPDKIEGFEGVKFYSLIRSSEGYNNLVIMRFKDEKALAVYQEHPDHLKIKELAKPLVSEMGKFDYWK